MASFVVQGADGLFLWSLIQVINLEGTLSSFIGNLSFLRKLNLSSNFFRGNIPHQVSQLPRLRSLNMAINSFDGGSGGQVRDLSFLDTLTNCTTLRHLSIQSNFFTGRLPFGLACSSIDAQRNDFKALIYEYMPRGSLESWLHSSNHVCTGGHINDSNSCSLSLFQRLSIAIDVACALEYLHTGCASPIIHCDLKPSNILLDNDMTAHVGDFGLSKFLPNTSILNDTSSNRLRGTIGYVPPEYGLGCKVSPHGDIYSYGIIVLEMMTSKKPTNPMFHDSLNLHDFVKSAFPTRVMEVIDLSMLGEANLLPARNGADIN